MTTKELVVRIEDLPSTDNEAGDRRLVLFEKKIYQWNGSHWVMEKDVKEKIERYLGIKESGT